MKSGKLFVVGVGPGDPELLTLKGLRILKEAACVCVPKGREEGTSLALSIVSGLLDMSGKDVFEAYFPMRKTKGSDKQCDLDSKWHDTVEAVLARLNRGLDTVFITIGDPTIYSTFFYLHERLLDLNPELEIEIIPGVSSINASAARSGTYLGIADEKIAVLPANYISSLRETLEKFDTVVLMKAHKVFDSVRSAVSEMGLSDKTVYVSRAGMADEKIIRGLSNVKDEDLGYFSVVIIKR